MSDADQPASKPTGCIPWDLRHRCHPRPASHAHLIGIAGCGLRSLGRVLLGWGWKLSGSDLAVDSIGALAEAGVRIHGNHAPEHLPPQTDLVVYSDAIRPDNPELRRAAELGIPRLSYFETLGRIMSGRLGLAVAGTHGKSTTTAMAAKLLVDAGLDPTVVFGAAPLGDYCGGLPGSSDLMLVEACEYRANFLHLRPQQAVILGIERDHFDCYGSISQLERAFARFAGSVGADGLILARVDCLVTRRATAGLKCRVETFGMDPQADWSARRLRCRQGRYRFEIFRHGREICEVGLRIPGRHNVLNALAAAALAWENGVGGERIAGGLGSFRGLHRRLEELGCWRGVVLLDDYAHHPTEVAATLRAVRRMFPRRRVWCVFQPHQASRTERLLDELANSLQNADKVVVAEIFRAREPPPGRGEVTAADLARRVREGGTDVPNLHATEKIARLLQNGLLPGDVLITMGAGDIGKTCHGFADGLRENRAAI